MPFHVVETSRDSFSETLLDPFEVEKAINLAVSKGWGVRISAKGDPSDLRILRIDLSDSSGFDFADSGVVTLDPDEPSDIRIIRSLEKLIDNGSNFVTVVSNINSLTGRPGGRLKKRA